MGHQGAMDGPAFAAYIREILVPEIAPGTVVILDNLATHRNKEAAQALRDHGCWFLYLPPYSPDLNPIEQAYSKLKAHLRRIGARTFTEVFGAIGSLCDLYDPKECRICLRLMSKSFREALVGTTSVHVPAERKTLVRGGAGRPTLYEHRAKTLLEMLDALRDGRRGHIERRGRPFEAAGPDDSGYGPERCVIHRHLAYLHPHQGL